MVCFSVLLYSQERVEYVNCNKEEAESFVNLLTDFEGVEIQEYTPSYIKKLQINSDLIRVIQPTHWVLNHLFFSITILLKLNFVL